MSYLLLQDGASHLLLQDGGGAVLLQAQAAGFDPALLPRFQPPLPDLRTYTPVAY